MDRLTRTPPVRFWNRRARRLQQAFAGALGSKLWRCEHEDARAAHYAPIYAAYGERVRQADAAAPVSPEDDVDVAIVNGRIVVRGRDIE